MPGAMLVERAWFEKVGGFDRTCEIAEDWDLFLRLALLGCPMGWTRASVCQYRQHAGNSVMGLAARNHGTQQALEKLLAQPDLPAEARAEAARARAWMYIVFARRAFMAGEAQDAQAFLQRAVHIFPPFAGERRGEALEALLAAPTEATLQPEALRAAVIGELPIELGATTSDLRQAQARVAMAQFFRMARSDTPRAARPYLQAGLRLDARWLTNRGVWSYLVRHVLLH
jgi:hypothetical protein